MKIHIKTVLALRFTNVKKASVHLLGFDLMIWHPHEADPCTGVDKRQAWNMDAVVSRSQKRLPQRTSVRLLRGRRIIYGTRARHDRTPSRLFGRACPCPIPDNSDEISAPFAATSVAAGDHGEDARCSEGLAWATENRGKPYHPKDMRFQVRSIWENYSKCLTKTSGKKLQQPVD